METAPIPDLGPKRIAAFWERVDRSCDGCHEWTGDRDADGYGRVYFRIDGTFFRFRSHRLAWALTFSGPGDQWVLHRCDNQPCCNPAHLFLGNNQDNQADLVAKGLSRAGEEHPFAALSEAQVATIRRLRSEGMKLREIREAVGATVSLSAISGACIRSWQRSLDRPIRVGSRRGEAHGNAKLSDADVRTIRSLYAAGGVSQRVLGERFGVCQAQVSRIVLREQR